MQNYNTQVNPVHGIIVLSLCEVYAVEQADRRMSVLNYSTYLTLHSCSNRASI